MYQTILLYTAYGFLILFGIATWSYLMKLIESLGKYFIERTKADAIDNYREKIYATNDTLQFIDKLIETEVLKEIQSIQSLNIKYEVRNLDNDIEHIASIVYQSLTPDIKKEIKNIIMTSDAISHYIIEMTKSVFLSYILKVRHTEE